MKKILVGLCAATMMSVPAFAAGTTNVLSPKHTAVVTQKSPVVQYTLKINNKTVELGTEKIVVMEDQIMVPLKITSEALGFTLKLDEQKQSIHMDNATMQTDLTVGEDTYFAYSSKAIGMTAPLNLGVAPAIIEGSIYVPVDLYKVLLTDPNCVSIKDRVINISTGPMKPKKTASIGLPNPLVNYSTLDEARKAVGFTFAVPATLPDGYQMKNIIVISNELVEISYLEGDNQITYRTAKGNADISGDYNVYDKDKTITVGNTKITVKGKGDSINLATWTKDGTSFSLAFDVPVNEKTLSTIIERIK
ncbi:copper amine oxidase [Brevibacillus sp. SKDU10]|uniref:stalk domain-containing protein n=1 Tax=Brevibacillus sp. SKDU10 TaxID=1247872 RepID=UPI0007C93644|nr:stalk domain-containing protein [Brevibacillus sp. SKDU10]OAJ73333.1 copper amine oxidase [Brevibacillus sp. SKDU10]